MTGDRKTVQRGVEEREPARFMPIEPQGVVKQAVEHSAMSNHQNPFLGVPRSQVMYAGHTTLGVLSPAFSAKEFETIRKWSPFAWDITDTERGLRCPENFAGRWLLLEPDHRARAGRDRFPGRPPCGCFP